MNPTLQRLTFVICVLVLFMSMSRFFPKKDSVPYIIDQLVYMMSCMLEREHACAYGLAIVADFSEFSMANFTVQYFHKLLMILQGRQVPTRVESLLIVNPPTWFGNIWTMMKTMMSADFSPKVHRISFNDLGKHLVPGFENYMPNDIWMGRRDAQALVEIFAQERRQIERSVVHGPPR